ncbi:MAG: plastocyanin [Planctomycetota bacterium]|jgi:plastocyanin
MSLHCVSPIVICTALALSAGAASAQVTHFVELEAGSFNPSELTVAEGDTVQWTWITGSHNVVGGSVDANGAGSANGFFSSGVPESAPATFSVVFDHDFMHHNVATGKRYEYFCEVHAASGMVGAVTVEFVASGEVRNAGSNPDSLLLLNPPQFGSSLQMTLGVGQTGHTLGAILAFQSELNYQLPGGQTLLINLSDPGGELLSQGILFGSNVNWDIQVPNDPSLNGFWYTVQGIHAGAGIPFVLSNALDLTIGT